MSWLQPKDQLPNPKGMSLRVFCLALIFPLCVSGLKGVGVALRQPAGLASAGCRHLGQMVAPVFGGGRLGSGMTAMITSLHTSWARFGVFSRSWAVRDGRAGCGLHLWSSADKSFHSCFNLTSSQSRGGSARIGGDDKYDFARSKYVKDVITLWDSLMSGMKHPKGDILQYLRVASL